MPKEFNEVDVERATRFRINQMVKIVGEDPWVADWNQNACRVVGVSIDRKGFVSYWLMHDGDTITDGFSPENLAPI